MAAPRPRRPRRSGGPWGENSRPSKWMAPLLTQPGGSGRRPMRDKAVTVLPQPLSPTMPRVSPGSTWKEMPSTALTGPASVWNRVYKSFTANSLAAAMTSPPPFMPAPSIPGLILHHGQEAFLIQHRDVQLPGPLQLAARLLPRHHVMGAAADAARHPAAGGLDEGGSLVAGHGGQGARQDEGQSLQGLGAHLPGRRILFDSRLHPRLPQPGQQFPGLLLAEKGGHAGGNLGPHLGDGLEFLLPGPGQGVQGSEMLRQYGGHPFPHEADAQGPQQTAQGPFPGGVDGLEQIVRRLLPHA